MSNLTVTIIKIIKTCMREHYNFGAFKLEWWKCYVIFVFFNKFVNFVCFFNVWCGSFNLGADIWNLKTDLWYTDIC